MCEEVVVVSSRNVKILKRSPLHVPLQGQLFWPALSSVSILWCVLDLDQFTNDPVGFIDTPAIELIVGCFSTDLCFDLKYVIDDQIDEL